MSTHTNGAEAGPGPSSGSSGVLSPAGLSPRASSELPPRTGTPGSLEAELERTRAEKDHLSHQYRSLLGKLTAMRNTLGEKLKEDAEELDRREAAIASLTADNESLNTTATTLRAELSSASEECAELSAQLQQLRSQSDSSSSDVLSLTREMRELRGEMERLRAEREEWEAEAARERERRETAEDEMREVERRERDGRREWERAADELTAEQERAANLQEVLGEFQEAKDSELYQATAELEGQLKLAAAQLSEYKLRAANAESELTSLATDAGRLSVLEKELKDKKAVIAKLRHDAVVNNEHLTEALRRLRKNTSDNNVDRRLVTNVLLAFLSTSRGDAKRFEMLSLLSTVLGWDDNERERAGLQRSQKRAPMPRRKSSAPKERTEEDEAMNESFSNLFVEFLLKEASQGAERSRPSSSGATGSGSPGGHSHSGTASGMYSPSPPASGATTPALYASPQARGARAMSSSSSTSGVGVHSLDAVVAQGRGRKASFGLQEALGR